ncbi:Ty3/gypsy retrotransposon protein [Cucumis melo var. makuwa]|uniref:Ty3/gypsy retrotransposon protein n=1 Tax=Cucumis melo var. makuwa TaxID=1194695 RepID=A0A5A7UHV0_CUCMM|nr:Ty3/gypsy retrotransposon protein [Cucumis melo var. makuwa]
MKKEIMKVPAIESSLSEISRNLELMRLQFDKHQHMLLLVMESVMHESVFAKGKEKEESTSKSADNERIAENGRNERKAENDDTTADRRKFKKVEMSVFSGEDPDSWLFRAKSTPTGNKENTTFPIRTVTLRSSNANEVKKETNYRRLPDAEFQARKEKGLCFHCNEKYSADHKCKMKELRELRMFVVAGEDEEYEMIKEKEPAVKEFISLEVKENNQTVIELSINLVVGLNDPGTMKVKGRINNKEIVVMINCGATHNFISEKLVKSLPITIKETAHYGVILGSSTAIQGKGVCESVEIQLADWKVIEDFLSLELGGVDVILGMQWLHSLGVTIVDWKNLTFSFTCNGEGVCIKGDPSLTKTRISLKSMFKTWSNQDGGYLIECRAIELKGGRKQEAVEKQESSWATNSIHNILKKFDDVFTWPEKMPPRREIEHQIHLKGGTDPINVRPYRYSFHQKAEMEKLVEEMLMSGVIRPSKSPFSGLVLLVKKKDGSWRFCVDYRAINNVTISDKFPIPVVEELFDEFNGASLFSK